MGGFLQVQFLVIFSACDFKPLSSDLLTISMAESLLPSPLYFEKNIGDSMISSLYPFILSVHDAFSSYTVASILTKFAACLSHLLGSCSIMLISGPEQRVKRLNVDFCPLLCVLLGHCVQDLKVICCLPS